MIKIENFETMGWESAIRGMRNPMNSWERSDTSTCYGRYETQELNIGKNDLELMTKLAKGGSVHGLSQIPVLLCTRFMIKSLL